VEQELMKLEQASLDAALKKDRAALERLYAMTFSTPTPMVSFRPGHRKSQK
jgi:hypothetical protein